MLLLEAGSAAEMTLREIEMPGKISPRSLKRGRVSEVLKQLLAKRTSQSGVFRPRDRDTPAPVKHRKPTRHRHRVINHVRRESMDKVRSTGPSEQPNPQNSPNPPRDPSTTRRSSDPIDLTKPDPYDEALREAVDPLTSSGDESSDGTAYDDSDDVAPKSPSLTPRAAERVRKCAAGAGLQVPGAIEAGNQPRLAPVLRMPGFAYGSYERKRCCGTKGKITHSFDNKVDDYFGLPKTSTPTWQAMYAGSPSPTPAVMASPSPTLIAIPRIQVPLRARASPYNLGEIMRNLEQTPSPMFDLEMEAGEVGEMETSDPDPDLLSQIPSDTSTPRNLLQSSHHGTLKSLETITPPPTPTGREEWEIYRGGSCSPDTVIEERTPRHLSEDYPDLPRHNIFNLLREPVPTPNNLPPAEWDTAEE